MSNKQQTAVEQLAIALYEGGFLQGDGDKIQDLVDKAKEMEKEQIKKAWVDSDYNTDDDGNPSENYSISDEHYYEQTYGGN
jgi:hypothetical protein